MTDPTRSSAAGFSSGTQPGSQRKRTRQPPPRHVPRDARGWRDTLTAVGDPGSLFRAAGAPALLRRRRRRLGPYRTPPFPPARTRRFPGLSPIGAPRFELGTSSPPDFFGGRARGGGEWRGVAFLPANNRHSLSCEALSSMTPVSDVWAAIGQRGPIVTTRRILASAGSHLTTSGRGNRPGRSQPHHRTMRRRGVASRPLGR